MKKTDSKTQFHTLRLILGDQLNRQHSWFDQVNTGVIYVIAELHQEVTYVRHHVQKLCAFFAAMQAFADEIDASGHNTVHLTLDDTIKHENLSGFIRSVCRQYGVSRFEYQSPDEYRLREQLRNVELPDAIRIKEFDSEHFLLPKNAVRTTISFRASTIAWNRFTARCASASTC